MNGPITDALRTVRAGKTAAAVALLAVAAVSLAVSLAVVATGPALPIADDSADGLTPATDGPTPAAGESGAESAVVEGVDATDAAATDAADGTSVTVTYTTRTNRTGTNATDTFTVDGVDPALVDASGDWAYLPRDSLPAALEQVAGDHTAGVVTVGQWALVGDLAASVRERVRVTVVAPAGMAVDPGRKAGFLVKFLEPYSFRDGPAERVTLVVAPDALPAKGRTYDRTGYVTQHAFWDGDVGSVWIHEYVHARRTFALAPGMRWFSEASATYVSYRVLEEQYDAVTDADVLARFAARPDFEGVALANRSAWKGTGANYDRGAKLLYAVDAAVRAGSDGNHTLVDVFRALDRRDRPVSVPAFVRTVERYSGDDETWLRTAITDPGDLDQRVERASRVFANRTTVR